MRATKAIIHLQNFRHNISTIQAALASGTKMCVAVKADAYGHGAIRCAHAAVEAGADMLAVATPEEGIALRKSGITQPILMLSLCAPEEVEAVVHNSITPLVFDEEYIALFAEAAKKECTAPYPVHLAVDTGMGRIGVLPEDAAHMARAVMGTGVLVLGGMGTHCAVSDSLSAENRAYTEQQFSRFLQAVSAVQDAGIAPGIRHFANSAVTLARPDMHLDMVRPGIIAYGYYPDEITASYLESIGCPAELRPVMTLETQVCAIRPFRKGQSIGYGRTWTAAEDTDIAVLPIGYGDGFLRRFAQGGIQVAIRDKAYPVRGRICMDQCMVDIGKNSGIRRWDRAVIFGVPEDGALQSADDVARLSGTISYEITSCLSPRVERVFVD